MRTPRLQVEKFRRSHPSCKVPLGTGEAGRRKWLSLGFDAAADAN